ncbi:LutC/YkgG family protein [Algiphilus sp.]|uniref:LutC/YkgG family protein n=1 Tax=Algiphilus sp. TaxID=1872431 RepID=UPI003C54963D
MSAVSAESHRARRAIFQRLRHGASARNAATPAGDQAPYITPWQDGADLSVSRTTRFIDNARNWQAEVVEATPDTWLQCVVDLIAERELQSVAAGRDSAISEALAGSALADRMYWLDGAIETCRETLFNGIDAGITTATGGVAQTGSLLLQPTVAEPRVLSLIPPVHVAVVHESTLHETLHDAMREQRWVEAMPSNMLMVTGPTKTADIQRMLVYGVHGPRALIVVLIRDAAGGVA